MLTAPASRQYALNGSELDAMSDISGSGGADVVDGGTFTTGTIPPCP